jgi:hypothetical protein
VDAQEYVDATHHYIRALQARMESPEDYPERDYMPYFGITLAISIAPVDPNRVASRQVRHLDFL